MKCSVCNEDLTKSYLKCTIICQSCYKYIHDGGKIYETGPAGTLAFVEDKPICHICGQAHNKLGNHVYYKHKMTTKDYKDKFLLPHSTKLTSSNYSQMMRLYNKAYRPLVVEKNLIKGGVKTRYTKKDPRSVGQHKKRVTIIVIQ